MATLHMSIALITYLDGAWARTFDISWLRAGALAWLILLALWLTSYPALVRALGLRLWKPLHRLAYVAGLLAFQHTLLSPFAPRDWVLAVFALTGLVAMLRLGPRRWRLRSAGKTSEPRSPDSAARAE